jgi:hypothetical protein
VLVLIKKALFFLRSVKLVFVIEAVLTALPMDILYGKWIARLRAKLCSDTRSQLKLNGTRTDYGCNGKQVQELQELDPGTLMPVKFSARGVREGFRAWGANSPAGSILQEIFPGFNRFSSARCVVLLISEVFRHYRHKPR